MKTFIFLLLFSTGAIAGVFNGSLEQSGFYCPNVLCTPVPAGFRILSAGNVVNESVYPAGGANGSIGFKLRATYVATGGAVFFIQDEQFAIPVTPGTWRTYQDQTKCTSSMRVIVQYRTTTGGYLTKYYPAYTVADSTWHKIRYNIQIPPGVVSAMVGRVATKAGTCNVDNLYFGPVLQ